MSSMSVGPTGSGIRTHSASRLPTGSLTIPAHLVRQWTAQMNTPCTVVSDGVKDSDREQVYRYLPTIAAALKADGS